jgi:hypothetical protein
VLALLSCIPIRSSRTCIVMFAARQKRRTADNGVTPVFAECLQYPWSPTASVGTAELEEVIHSVSDYLDEPDS